MAFSSSIRKGEIIIHDSTPFEAATPPGKGRGLIPGRRTPYGAIPFASAFPDHMLIPRSEWPDRIKELEERKDRLSDHILRSGLRSKNQQQTNFCWANGPVGCVEVLRIRQGNRAVSLSPASVAAPIKNYRNEGGWGEEALRFIVEQGIAPTLMWPDNAIDRRYNNDTTAQARKLYRAHEWIECVPRNMDQLFSLLLLGIPVAVGLNWWAHEVYYCDPLIIDGAIAARARNSWGDEYGSRGFFILQGQRLPADDAVAPLSIVSS